MRLIFTTKISYFGFHILDQEKFLTFTFQLFRPTDYWYYFQFRLKNYVVEFKSWKGYEVRSR